MANAGLPSQKALACEIAKREGLSNPPTALVSKVFNEERVDAVQLARVALALGVPAPSIHHDQQDTHAGPDDDATSGAAAEERDDVPVVVAPTEQTIRPRSQAANWSRPALLATAATGVLLLAVAIWYFT
jgi:hypothetical protein